MAEFIPTDLLLISEWLLVAQNAHRIALKCHQGDVADNMDAWHVAKIARKHAVMRLADRLGILASGCEEASKQIRV